MKKLKSLAALLLFLGAGLAWASGQVAGVSPEEALEKLASGNKRFVAAGMTRPNCSPEYRAQLAKGQNPFAIVLGCSDSRVPPEILFDQGLGDLFVVRTAGNVADAIALGSIEYAAEHLGSRLLVVLGHEKCGAVNAACQGGHAPGHIGAVVKAIHPAVASAKKQQGELVDNAVRENVKVVTKQLLGSKPILAKLVKEGRLKVVGARYDLDTGEVEFLK